MFNCYVDLNIFLSKFTYPLSVQSSNVIAQWSEFLKPNWHSLSKSFFLLWSLCWYLEKLKLVYNFLACYDDRFCKAAALYPYSILHKNNINKNLVTIWRFNWSRFMNMNMDGLGIWTVMNRYEYERLWTVMNGYNGYEYERFYETLGIWTV